MISRQLRLAFAGTPELAASILSDLLTKTEHQIVCVLTQPDRPAGRGKKLRFSPVKQRALDAGLPVFQPANKQELTEISELGTVDLMVVVAYGVIIPESVLNAPEYGCINIHTSLLPRWRGAAPIQRSIEAGDSKTGVSIMQMDSGLDTGPVITQISCPIEQNETAESLHDKLTVLGSQGIRQTLDELVSGKLNYTEQDNSQATYASKIHKQEAELDWQQDALTLERKIRAFNPAPVAHTSLNGQNMKVWQAKATMQCDDNAAAGQIIDISKDGLYVACQSGQLLIQKLQLPGKKPVTVKELLNGRPAFLEL